jgi:hypothetical protein
LSLCFITKLKQKNFKMTEEKLKKIRELDKEVAALQREVKKKKKR